MKTSRIKIILKLNRGKSFSPDEAIDLMVPLSATDINSELIGKVSTTHYQRLN